MYQAFSVAYSSLYFSSSVAGCKSLTHTLHRTSLRIDQQMQQMIIVTSIAYILHSVFNHPFLPSQGKLVCV